MGLRIVGEDSNGVTQISLEGLYGFRHKELKEIQIVMKPDDSWQESFFVFEDDTVYKASGFATGYRGEGPRGLYKVIKMFWPDWPANYFEDSLISNLDIDRSHVINKEGILPSKTYQTEEYLLSQ